MMNNNWTDVRDELPKKTDIYLVTLDKTDYNKRNGFIYAEDLIVCETTFFTSNKTWGVDTKNESFVIAWQPKPKPYKRKEK